MGMWTNTAGTKWRRRAGLASVPPLAHCFTQTPPESQHQGVKHTGPSPAGIPPLPCRVGGFHSETTWSSAPRRRVGHQAGPEVCTVNGGREPSGRTWGLWGVRALLPGR